ncbi:AAA family ATPase [Chitiniphilus eburneus]|uniref:MoxR family ATPase n=1 Tax=Chitiniphilus eburneus TaxID=2571148 RepID=A0A4U0PY29_9NEIS|nr:MoxR family ATPase [Chitiniphilus eburneus]TJZ73516.1 MoxR family ATPase [Chitiniphilus eburneus]
MAHSFSPTLAQLNRVILGKEDQVRMALCCLLARGHLLLEDLPGVGKTTLAHALAATVGLRFQRVQFTSDLLPADLIGVSIYERDTGRFRFHHGPVFAQVLLADEINRAPPKTQSALLEAMEEQQVTVDGTSYPLPEPFFVIATQNPQHQIGTFPLPESQLDRFLMRLELGYPDGAAERAMLAGESRRELVAQLQPTVGPTELTAAQQQVDKIHVSGPLLDYVQALARATRSHDALSYGLSPRALLGLIAAARAWAWLDGRDHVIPEDVQAVFPGVAGHRLVQRASGRVAPDAALELLRTVAIP